MPTDHLAVLEELKARLNAIEFDVACGSLSAAQTFTKVRDAHAAAIALMRGQSEDAEVLDEMYLYELPNGAFESISPAATDLFRPDMLLRVLVADRNAGTRPAPPAAKQERDDA